MLRTSGGLLDLLRTGQAPCPRSQSLLWRSGALALRLYLQDPNTAGAPALLEQSWTSAPPACDDRRPRKAASGDPSHFC